MNKVDVKIMAVQSRKTYAEYVFERVKENPTAQICYDPRGFNGVQDPWGNAKRIWLMEPAVGCTHKLVLQDDIDLVYDFLFYVDKCITFQPNAVWGFFISYYLDDVITDNPDTPFVRIRGCRMSGQAILIPNEYVSSIVSDTDAVFGTDYKHDDNRIGWWCAMNGIPVFTPNPALVQHRTMSSTVMHKPHTTNKWIGKDIGKEPINWDARTYIETNLATAKLLMKPENKHFRKANEYCRIAKERERSRK